jgi:hypothetical protein
MIDYEDYVDEFGDDYGFQGYLDWLDDHTFSYSGGSSRKMPKVSAVIAIILALIGITCIIFGNSGIKTLGIFSILYPVGYVLVILLKGIAGLIVSFLRLLLKALPFIIGIGVLALIIYLVF